MYETAVFVCAIVAGATAAVSGFGIGSLLTPLLALHAGTKTAVAAVSIPHLIGTAIRFWRLRASLDRALLWRFGLTSAAGGLVGALLNARAPSPALTVVLGSLLVLAGSAQITGSAQRWRFHGSVAWIAGAISGLFGGLVGNQGGIRSAAMLGFDLPKERFVATATAIALFVDAARMPVYLWPGDPRWKPFGRSSSSRPPASSAGRSAESGSWRGCRNSGSGRWWERLSCCWGS